MFKSVKDVINNYKNNNNQITEEKLKEIKQFRDNNNNIIDKYNYINNNSQFEVSSQSVQEAVDYEINSYIMDKQFRIHKLENRTDLPSDMYFLYYYLFGLVLHYQNMMN